MVRLLKNVLKVFHINIANLARYRKWFFFFFGTQKSTDSQCGHLGKRSWKIIVGAFDHLAKWWWIAVDRFEHQSQEKSLGPKNNFSKFGFWTIINLCVDKSYQYPNSNSSLFGPIVEKHVGILHEDIANLARYRKLVFFIWDPKFDWFPVRPFGLMFVKNNLWGVWPPYQMMNNCCWPIWAPKSGIKFRPKKQFSQIWFLYR